jgi:hypothetical protein
MIYILVFLFNFKNELCKNFNKRPQITILQKLTNHICCGDAFELEQVIKQFGSLIFCSFKSIHTTTPNIFELTSNHGAKPNRQIGMLALILDIIHHGLISR